IGATGGGLTLVSPLGPVTILVTATPTLVYLQSRFVPRPAGRPLDAHHGFSLTNKIVARPASLFATAVGFAALMVSDIRPIREMGLWVAIGLLCTWVVVFTLFPALQKVLRTPTEQERPTAGGWLLRLAGWIPLASWRWRWSLVASSL